MGLSAGEVETAVRLYREGAPYRVVAAQLRRSWADVRAAIRAAAVTRSPGRRRRTDVQDEDIVYLCDVERLSWRQISSEVGMVPSGCRRRYARARGGVSAAEARRL